MRTVRTLLVMAIALSIAIPVMAQEKKAAKDKAPKLSPIARAMVRIGKLRSALDELDLTAEQKDELDKVREELRAKMADAFNKLRDILTEEQRSAAEEAGRKAREAGEEGRSLMLAIESAVKPTDEQKEKLDKLGQELWLPLVRETTKKVMGILTPEQKETVKKKMAPQGRKDRTQDRKKKEQ